GLAEELGDLLGERRVQLRQLAARLEPPHELRRGADAHVARDERLLEPLPVRIVARIEGRRGSKLARQRPARLRERVAEAREEASSAFLLHLASRVRLTEQLRPATRRVATPRRESGAPPCRPA